MIAVQTATTTVQVHDELAELLARNLTLGSAPYSMPVPEPPVQAPAPPAQLEQPKIVYSISQHYHHSAHVIKPEARVEVTQQPEQQQQQQQPTPEQVLVQNGIDPTTLTDVQLALFKMSAPDRRDYLLQLWRICPPTRPATATANGPWDTIDVEMDKEIASSELRVQQSQSQAHQQAASSPQGVMSLDGTIVSTAESAPTQSADGRWVQFQSESYMEPYMASGYEELARREYMASSSPSGYGSEASVPRTAHVPGVQLRYSKATDPVYSNQLSSSGRQSWPQAHYTAADMENQYGALMAMREGCDMEM